MYGGEQAKVTGSLLYETLLYIRPSGKLVLRFSLFPPQLAPPGGSRSSRQVGGVHPWSPGGTGGPQPHRASLCLCRSLLPGHTGSPRSSTPAWPQRFGVETQFSEHCPSFLHHITPVVLPHSEHFFFLSQFLETMSCQYFSKVFIIVVQVVDWHICLLANISTLSLSCLIFG